MRTIFLFLPLLLNIFSTTSYSMKNIDEKTKIKLQIIGSKKNFDLDYASIKNSITINNMIHEESVNINEPITLSEENITEKQLSTLITELEAIKNKQQSKFFSSEIESREDKEILQFLNVTSFYDIEALTKLGINAFLKRFENQNNKKTIQLLQNLYQEIKSPRFRNHILINFIKHFITPKNITNKQLCALIIPGLKAMPPKMLSNIIKPIIKPIIESLSNQKLIEFLNLISEIPVLTKLVNTALVNKALIKIAVNSLPWETPGETAIVHLQRILGEIIDCYNGLQQIGTIIHNQFGDVNMELYLEISSAFDRVTKSLTQCTKMYQNSKQLCEEIQKFILEKDESDIINKNCLDKKIIFALIESDGFSVVKKIKCLMRAIQRVVVKFTQLMSQKTREIQYNNILEIFGVEDNSRRQTIEKAAREMLIALCLSAGVEYNKIPKRLL